MKLWYNVTFAISTECLCMPIDPAVVIATWTTKPLRSCCYGSPWNSWRAVARRGCGKQVFWSSLHTLTPKVLLEEKKEDLGILKMSIWNFLSAIQRLFMIRKSGNCEYLIIPVFSPNLCYLKGEQWNQVTQMKQVFLSGFDGCIRAHLIIDMSTCCTRCNTETIISQEAVKHFCGE